MITNIDNAFAMLSSAMRSGKAFHAIFISSPDGRSGLSLARRAAAYRLTGSANEAAADSQADIFMLKGEETAAKDIRALIDELAKAAFGGGDRAIIISAAHLMPREAQNTLLKTLEEPPANAMFLLVGNADSMLGTIISRCMVIRLGQPSLAEIEAELAARGADAADARLYAHIGAGSAERAARLFEDAAFAAHRVQSINALIAAFGGEISAAAAKAIAKAGAGEGLAFMLSFAGDMLSLNMGGLRQIDNIDMQPAAVQCAARFTTRQILCIIDMITKANEELYLAQGGDMYPAAVLDKLFLSILKECNG